jgi:hypothetical protein
MKNLCRFAQGPGGIVRVWRLLLLLAVLLCVAAASSAQQIGARAKKESSQGVHKRYGVYVPPTDISRGPLGDKGAQTTYWLATGLDNKLLTIASDDVDTSVLKNIRHAYGVPDQGGTSAIAIVVAYHHPSVADDLREFSRVFNLPPCDSGPCLEVIKPQNVSSSAQYYCDWANEAEIGLQWAHAIAPKAKLLLVEAETSQPSDLFAAVQKATQRLLALGGGQILLAWGFREGEGRGEINAATEQQYDAAFSEGVVYFAASGDAPQVVSYPAASAKVVSVGGTIPTFDQTGELVGEAGWSGSGGGHSRYVAKPIFQNGVDNTSSDHRSTPDLAMSADYVLVYDAGTCSTTTDHWQLPQGTSVSVVLAGALANAVGSRKRSSAEELKNIYANRKNLARIRDIVSVRQGTTCCAVGYDTYTGVGVPASRDFDAPLPTLPVPAK